MQTVKRKFVVRKANLSSVEQASVINAVAVAAELERPHAGAADRDASYARHVAKWMEDEKVNTAQLQLAAQYAAWAALSPEGKARHHAGVL